MFSMFGHNNADLITINHFHNHLINDLKSFFSGNLLKSFL